MCLMPEEELAKCKLSPYKEIALQYAKEKKQRDVEFLTFPITGIDYSPTLLVQQKSKCFQAP